MTAAVTRNLIVETADRLFYETGVEATSFADIAGAVGLSRGNFYYHFKSKDQILEAVIARRIERTRAMLAAWEAEGATPGERIGRFIDLLVVNRAAIMAHGCPVGTLCEELAKLEHVALSRATALFDLFRHWLASQFAALGRGRDADHLALHLLMRSQGVATLATAYRDEVFIRREVAAMHAWLDAEAAPPDPSKA